MLVVRFHLSEKPPEFFPRREAVKSQYDFVNLARCCSVQLPDSSMMAIQGLGFSENNSSIYRHGSAKHSGEDRCGRVSLTMPQPRRPFTFPSRNERSIAREYIANLPDPRRAWPLAWRGLCRLRLLQKTADSAEPRLGEGGYLLPPGALRRRPSPAVSAAPATDNVSMSVRPPAR